MFTLSEITKFVCVTHVTGRNVKMWVNGASVKFPGNILAIFRIQQARTTIRHKGSINKLNIHEIFNNLGKNGQSSM